MRNDNRPGHKEWSELLRSLDAAIVLTFVIEDLHDAKANYFTRLSDRLIETFSERQDILFDGFAQRFIGDPDDISLLEIADQLSEEGPPEDLAYLVRGLAATAMHSALDAYVKALIPAHRGRLPEAIDAFLRGACESALDRMLYEGLVELDATRHILVHNRGIVDDRYISRVLDNTLLLGERRPLSRSALVRYGGIVLANAQAVHKCVTTKTR
jgi:hypothetical protein